MNQTMIDAYDRLMDQLRKHEPGTHAHSERAGVLAEAIAFEAGVKDRRDLILIRLAGALHDVGKRFMPLEILTGDVRFTRTDKMFIQHVVPHPMAGARVSEARRIVPEAVRLIGEHHERLDGRGYPFRLPDKAIDWRTHYVSTADMYDAMTDSARHYRRPKTPDEAVSILRDEVGNSKLPERPVRALLALHQRGEITTLFERAEPMSEVLARL